MPSCRIRPHVVEGGVESLALVGATVNNDVVLALGGTGRQGGDATTSRRRHQGPFDFGCMM